MRSDSKEQIRITLNQKNRSEYGYQHVLAKYHFVHRIFSHAKKDDEYRVTGSPLVYKTSCEPQQGNLVHALGNAVQNLVS